MVISSTLVSFDETKLASPLGLASYYKRFMKIFTDVFKILMPRILNLYWNHCMQVALRTKL